MLDSVAFFLSCCFQSFLMIYCGSLFFDLHLSARQLGWFAAAFGSTVVLIRNLYLLMGWPMGTHTLLLILFMVLLAMLIGKIRPTVAIGIAFFSFSMLMLGTVIGGAALLYFHVDQQTSVNNIWLSILFANLTENLFLLVYILLSQFFLINVHSFGMKNRG